MTKKKKKCLHKYQRVNIGNKTKPYLVYRCTRPGCAHYIQMTLALGMACECNRCGKIMVLTKESLTLAKPHCAGCVERKDSDRLSALEGLEL